MKKPYIALTSGDPKGIGPEIIQMCLADKKIRSLANWFWLGEDYDYDPDLSHKECGLLSYQFLQQAVLGLKANDYDAVVTGPVSKENLKLAGFKYLGQTEYFAEYFATKSYGMMLCAPKLKVMLSTVHIPLQAIWQHLTTQLIYEKIVLAHHSLKTDFAIKNPKIAVCGLNPHAGENGLMGTEEKTIISPAIKKALKNKICVFGPLSADTVFNRAIKGDFDLVLAHYHDQGLIGLKTLYFDEGVNYTAGLKVVRTSPDHGTAFDIANKGLANPLSFKKAMEQACFIVKNRSRVL